MTRQEKAHDTRVFKLARMLAGQIADLPQDYTLLQVLKIWQNVVGFGPRVKCDAFWVMDNEPSRFARYQEWHPRLRSLRNHPELGEALFDLFH